MRNSRIDQFTNSWQGFEKNSGTYFENIEGATPSFYFLTPFLKKFWGKFCSFECLDLQGRE